MLTEPFSHEIGSVGRKMGRKAGCPCSLPAGGSAASRFQPSLSRLFYTDSPSCQGCDGCTAIPGHQESIQVHNPTPTTRSATVALRIPAVKTGIVPPSAPAASRHNAHFEYQQTQRLSRPPRVQRLHCSFQVVRNPPGERSIPDRHGRGIQPRPANQESDPLDISHPSPQQARRPFPAKHLCHPDATPQKCSTRYSHTDSNTSL